jgi:hypothetical protein
MMRLVFCLLGIVMQSIVTSSACPQKPQFEPQGDSETRPRIGDPGWVFDESRYDPRFPEMREWAKAGVEGGIPLRNTLPKKLRVSEGADLQSAIDRVAEQGGGVLVLGPGDYWIDRTIQLKSGVVMRGTHKDSTIIKIRMRAPFFKIAGGKSATAIEVNGQERVGVEDLTIRYEAVDFEPMDKSDFHAPWEINPFHGDEIRDDQLFVHSLIFANSRNCWVDNCNLLWAGAHPLGMANCQHMTMRDNFVDRAYVKKGGMHGGYYGVWGTSYSLFYNEKVRRIRHFALMSPGCKYNVVYQCDMEVDVNYHDADDGQNLVEKSRVATPVWHSWDAIGVGAQGKHRPPGPRNFLFDNTVISKGVEGYSRRGPVSETGKIYQVMTEFGQPTVSVMENASPPKGNTLYAVTRGLQN